MTQPIKLQLNAEALTALFPEGSQARVELQNAVVAEFVRKHIREAALGPDVQRQIERARADALDAVQRARNQAAATAVAEVGFIKDICGYVKLSDDLKKQIAEAARLAVQAQISADVGERVKAATDSLKANIAHDAQAAVNRLVNAEIATAVKARVQEVAKGVLGG